MSDGYFLVFSVDNKKSFERVIMWINWIEDYVNLEEKIVYLVGNKIDVKPEEREVTKEEIEEFAKNKNFKYFETSARTQKGINEAFEEMFKDFYEKSKIINKKKDNEVDIKINKAKTNYLYEIFKKFNKKNSNEHFEINKNDNKKNININNQNNNKNVNEHFEINNQNNEKKSIYSPFSNSNYILKKYTNY